MEKCVLGKPTSYQFVRREHTKILRIIHTENMDESLAQQAELLTEIFHALSKEIPESPNDAESKMFKRI